MKIFASLSALLCCAFILAAAGCSKTPAPPPPVQDLNELHQKFLKIAKDEYQLNVQLTPLDNTLYIYLPREEDILEIKVEDKPPAKSPIPKTGIVIRFIDVRYEPSAFHINYDIVPDKSYPQGHGYSVLTKKKFHEHQNNLFRAFFQAYSELYPDKLPGDVEFENFPAQKKHEKVVHYRPDVHAPDFIILIVADIKNGLEMKAIFHFWDFKRYMGQEMPHEEYVKRLLSELSGQQNIINDAKGMHIAYEEMTWPDFLSRQMVNRINFKYQQSSLPPGNDTEEELLKIIAATIKAYQFEDFQSVHLHDLNSGKDYSYDKSQLKVFEEE